ncbi:hydrogen peroxide-inducible genes activator [Gluconacetobacter diazotrophicus]|uniref:hydrogen peroxide-inducible genes activator n=1 Tax=Gluconacetobacter diazotrophicus TaxID=33996 RepID=UPI00119CF26A|nr:hydrogen peroxide-inducible genes activator [Gluconacetobacter diazotrophicus]
MDKTYAPLSGLSLRDIEYAVAVDDLRNFSRAAERCGVSQAGLSEQIRKLENLLGVVLFERSRRHVKPTPEGVRLLERARDVVAAARMMLEAAHMQSGPLNGTLRIGVIATLGPYYIPSMLPLLRKSYPDLRLQVTDGLTGPLLAKLQQDALDLVFAALPVPEKSFVDCALFEEPFVAAVPAGHPLARKRSLTTHDLDGPDLLLLEDGHCLRDQALALCGLPAQAQARQRLATSLEMLWHMIGAGEGHSLIPHLALRNRGEWRGLISIRPLADASRTIGAIWRKSDPRGPAFAELGDFLRQHVPEGCRPCDGAPEA